MERTIESNRAARLGGEEMATAVDIERPREWERDSEWHQWPARFSGKYLSLTSFRADGTSVATPVWFVQEGDRLYVETDGRSHKVRRIQRHPGVSVAPCTASGRLRGEPVTARASILLGPEPRKRVEALMADKYRFDKIFILPVYRAVQALRHRPGLHGDPVILAIGPAR
jgi:PPOX class probable F420-dependent enzyme